MKAEQEIKIMLEVLKDKLKRDKKTYKDIPINQFIFDEWKNKIKILEWVLEK